MPTFDPDDLSQTEKRRVVLQDADVQRQQQAQGSTYLSHTHSEAGGRFAVTEHQTITGVASPAPPPLPANSPWHGEDPVGPEPPLGYEINAMPELEPSTPPPVLVEATGAPVSAAPSSDTRYGFTKHWRDPDFDAH